MSSPVNSHTGSNEPAEDHPIEVVVATEPALFRDALSRALSARSGLRVIASGRGRNQIRPVWSDEPGVLLLDQERFERNRYHIVRRLRRITPRTRILVMAAVSTERGVDRALRAGACGLVGMGGSDLDTLVRAIQAVAAGEVWEGPKAGKESSRRVVSIPPRLVSAPASQLTKREREIADRVGQGFRNRDIALRLNISPETVKTHLTNIFRKLDVHSRVALGIRAFAESAGGRRAFGRFSPPKGLVPFLILIAALWWMDGSPPFPIASEYCPET